MTGASDTAELLKCAAAGDEAAFEQLFERYRSFLRRAIELRLDRRLRRRFDVSDVLQETQIAAYQRLRDYLEREPMPLRIWLRQLAFERLLNLREKHAGVAKRSVGREVRLAETSSTALAERLLAGEPSPSEQAVRAERREMVSRSISRLPPGDREILLMRTVEGLSHEEIACELEISAPAARKRYGRALIRLQQILQESNSENLSP